MELLKEFIKIQNIKNINELTDLYSVEDLKLLYQKTCKLDLDNDALFLQTISKDKIDIDIDIDSIKTMWENKNNIQKFNILLFKALTAIERNKILQTAEEITSKLSSVINHME